MYTRYTQGGIYTEVHLLGRHIHRGTPTREAMYTLWIPLREAMYTLWIPLREANTPVIHLGRLIHLLYTLGRLCTPLWVCREAMYTPLGMQGGIYTTVLHP